MMLRKKHESGHKLTRQRLVHGVSVTSVMGLIVVLASSGTASATAPAALHKPGAAIAGAGIGATPPSQADPRKRAAVRSASKPGAYASGALSTVTLDVVNGGYTAAGIGMRNLGSGTIKITGVPEGAKVTSAYLLWDILASQQAGSFAQGSVNGHAITGTAWNSGTSPCWSQAGSNWAYETDVTGLVTRNGAYSLTGFASGETDGADPFTVGSTPPLLEGASLVVVYQQPFGHKPVPATTIQIAAGATEIGDSTASAQLTGFTASSDPTAKTTYIVADGQQIGIKTAGVNGTTVSGIGIEGSDPQSVANYSQGNLWDTSTATVSPQVKEGDTSATASLTSSIDPSTGYYDCLVWVGQVLSVSAPYSFILSRSLMSPSQWKTVLSKPHHDYPAADIPVQVGTPYYAITAGTVTYTAPDPRNKGCGLGIKLTGTDGVTYTYCHGSARIVPNHAHVTANTELGLTGKTGHVTGPHLHFQINYPTMAHEDRRCPQTLLLALYEDTAPAPTVQTVKTLPTTGCVSKTK